MPSTAIKTPTENTKNEFYRVVGKSMYARVFDPANPAPAYADTIPVKWTLDVLVDSATKTKMQGLGIGFGKENPVYQGLVKTNGLDKQGYDGTYIRVSKNTSKKDWDAKKGMVKADATGKPIMVPAVRPPVVDSADNEIPYEAFQNGFAIGNLSEVEVTFTITKPSMGGFGRYGARLIRTKILELVKYTPKKGSFVFGAAEETAYEEDPSVLND